MLGFINSLFKKSHDKNKKEINLPFTEVNFIKTYPDFNNVEVFFVGNIWQHQTFKQGKAWELNTNFINDYIKFKDDYIKIKKQKNEPYLVNDIAWAYYNKYKLAYVSEHKKMKMWTKDKQFNFSQETKNMSKFFKWVEKDKCRKLLFDNEKEKRSIRMKLKEVNQKLKDDKSEILLKEKKELASRINEINNENKSLEIERKIYLNKTSHIEF